MFMRHPEFEKIHSDFLAHYNEDLALGEARYAAWVKALGLDESKGYREQAASRLGLKESFRWAQFLLQFVKEDTEARYYKVEALFPIETLKGDVFTSEELLQAARTLTGKPSNLNHDWQHMLPEIEIKAAQCEDNVVECLVRILKTSPICGMIDRGEIVNVSIEGDWTQGHGKGLVLTGLGWLTKDVLPGVPLTRIMPVEKIAESLTTYPPQEDRPATKPDLFLEEKDLTAIAGKIASKLAEKDSANVEKLKSEVAETKAKLSEMEDKLKSAQEALSESTGKLSEANRTVEDLRKQLPGGGLLKDPPKMMLVSEHIGVLEGLLPSAMVERSSMGMQRQCQAIRSVILKAKERLK